MFGPKLGRTANINDKKVCSCDGNLQQVTDCFYSARKIIAEEGIKRLEILTADQGRTIFLDPAEDPKSLEALMFIRLDCAKEAVDALRRK